MEEVKIRELPEKENIQTSDYIIVEDEDGTKKVLMKHFRSLVLSSLYFNSIDELKNTPERRLRDGDICETLGYHTAGDGGAAKYKIVYDPGAVEDGKFIHYLSYSDTLRAELIIGETINVHQFGAWGDGKHDDSEAIQAALDNAFTRTVEFNHGQKYNITNSLNIINDNIRINGNGAYLNPTYITGINIEPQSEQDSPIHDIIIDNLNFYCKDSRNAIIVNRAYNITINNSHLYEIGVNGIALKNSLNINIDNCIFDTLIDKNVRINNIIIDGEDEFNGNPASHVKVNINNCTFNNFGNAIFANSVGMDADTQDFKHIINVDNCDFLSNRSVYVDDCCINVSCSIESLNIKSCNALKTKTFLVFGGSSKGEVSCTDITHLYGNTVFDIMTTDAVLHLNNYINISPSMNMFGNMDSKLHSNIMWDFTKSDASYGDNNFSGEICDTIDPTRYSYKNGYSISGNTLTLRKLRNIHVDWSSSTYNLENIQNGIKGQLLYIRSSTGKNIIASPERIILGNSSIQLNEYTGILLKFDGLKWVQITNGNSTINNYTTVNSKSTYDIWKEMGNTGTPLDFIDDISGRGINSISARTNGNMIVFTFELSDGTVKTTSVVVPTT